MSGISRLRLKQVSLHDQINIEVLPKLLNIVSSDRFTYLVITSYR